MKKRTSLYHYLFLSILAAMLILSTTTIVNATTDENRYYLGSAVNSGLDNGYAETHTIGSNDPHWGWKLGEFYVTGYTQQTTDSKGKTVFLKNVGDTVTLWFDLQQDITQLNGNSNLTICEDGNGFDAYFGIPKTNYGRGTLIIRHIDHQNHASEPVIYTDFLAAKASGSAAVEVEFFEEGNYEVALSYEILEHKMDILGWDPAAKYHNYQIFFRFAVRNGNCMVYPFDVATGAELTNSAFTENGFYLDLAKSRYLDINVKKSIRTEGAEGLTEDTRFNKPAKDGEYFTDEGIYTITVHNQYTDQTTTKTIYVGTNDVLKAHVVTGIPINEIEAQVAAGSSISAAGTIIPPVNQPAPKSNTGLIIALCSSGVFLIAALILSVIVYKKKKATSTACVPIEE